MRDLFINLTSPYLANFADLDVYGCQPMTVGQLLDEFEVFPIFDEDEEGVVRL